VLGCCPRRVDRPISDRAACPPERRSWRPTSNLRSCWAATPRRPRVLPRRVDRPISDRAACPTERRSWRPTTNSRSCRSRQAKASSSASNPPIQGLLPAASPLSCSPSAQSSTFSAPFLLLLQFNVYVASPAFARTRPTPHPNTTRRTTCRCAAQRPLAAFQLGPSDTTVAHAPPPRLLFREKHGVQNFNKFLRNLNSECSLFFIPPIDLAKSTPLCCLEPRKPHLSRHRAPSPSARNL
jgi:hypothetical protein